MNRIDFPSLVVGVALIAFAAMTSTACGAVICDGPVDGAGGTGGGAAVDGEGTTGGTSGDPDPPGTGGATIVTSPKPTDHPSAGASGTWDVPSSVQLERCQATTAVPMELPSTPESSCNYLEIGLPGVMEYSIDPSTVDLDEAREDGWYLYEGCDEVGSPCVGRIEYQWDVEYLADNEWRVSFVPVHPACEYDHVTIYQTPTGELAVRSALGWKSCELTVHLQPTAEGLTIGAVRSATDEDLDPFACFMQAWGETHVGPQGLFLDALVDHLESLEWECQHP